MQRIAWSDVRAQRHIGVPLEEYSIAEQVILAMGMSCSSKSLSMAVHVGFSSRVTTGGIASTDTMLAGESFTITGAATWAVLYPLRGHQRESQYNLWFDLY